MRFLHSCPQDGNNSFDKDNRFVHLNCYRLPRTFLGKSGVAVGPNDGCAVGAELDTSDGVKVGPNDGCALRMMLGNSVGVVVGLNDGCALGTKLGIIDGVAVGQKDGWSA